MRPLMIGPEEKQAIQRCVEYARQREHWYVPAIPNSVIPGSSLAHVVMIPMGFRVVFSYTLNNDDKLYRHLSVSIDDPERWPSPEAVVMIAHEYGFTGEDSFDITNQMKHHGWLVDKHDSARCIVVAQEMKDATSIGN